MEDISAEDEEYRIKYIKFLGSQKPILLQNKNGSCPLLAIANILLLRNELRLDNCGNSVRATQIIKMIFSVLEKKKNIKIQQDDPTVTVHYKYNFEQLKAVLPSLRMGLNINLRFTECDAFEYTLEISIFDMLDINILHGWIIDKSEFNDYTNKVISQLSYNELMNKICIDKEKLYEMQKQNLSFSSSLSHNDNLVASDSPSVSSSKEEKSTRANDEAELCGKSYLPRSKSSEMPLFLRSCSPLEKNQSIEFQTKSSFLPTNTGADKARNAQDNKASEASEENQEEERLERESSLNRNFPDEGRTFMSHIEENEDEEEKRNKEEKEEKNKEKEEKKDEEKEEKRNKEKEEKRNKEKEEMNKEKEEEKKEKEEKRNEEKEEKRNKEKEEMNKEKEEMNKEKEKNEEKEKTNEEEEEKNKEKEKKDEEEEEKKDEEEEEKRNEEIITKNEEINKKNEEINKKNEEIIKKNEEIIKKNEEIIKKNEEIVKKEKNSTVEILRDSIKNSTVDKSFCVACNESISNEKESERNLECRQIREKETQEECCCFEVEEASERKKSVRNSDDDRAVNCSFESTRKSINKQEEETKEYIESIVITEFLESTASQLTCSGLIKLCDSVREKELCCLFRNNHFLVLFKYNCNLYTLATDVAFGDFKNIVWEKLDNVRGDSTYFNDSFELSNSNPYNDSHFNENDFFTKSASPQVSPNLSSIGGHAKLQISEGKPLVPLHTKFRDNEARPSGQCESKINSYYSEINNLSDYDIACILQIEEDKKRDELQLKNETRKRYTNQEDSFFDHSKVDKKKQNEQLKKKDKFNRDNRKHKNKICNIM